MNKKLKRGYLQISFAWMFALIVGAVILFLAIYFATKIVDKGDDIIEAKIGKEIGILLNPLETSMESLKTTPLTLPKESRIYNSCKDSGNFGMQFIEISQKSLGDWTETKINGVKKVNFQNKYIFSENYTQGKNFYLISKPFNLPFKVANLIFLTAHLDKYCFLEPPEEIEDDISDLISKQPNFLAEENCTGEPEEIRICFGFGTDCDINVDYNAGYVEKNNEIMSFGEDDALMYAAIFSSPEIYECQLSRLILRAKHLTSLYNDKANFVSQKECDSNLDLVGFISIMNSSENLGQIQLKANEIKENNEDLLCRIW